MIEITGQPLWIHIVTMDLMPAADLPTVLTTAGAATAAQVPVDRAGIEFREIDIEDHADGAAIVAQLNDGNLTVPTVLFDDGLQLINPSRTKKADSTSPGSADHDRSRRQVASSTTVVRLVSTQTPISSPSTRAGVVEVWRTAANNA